MADEKREGAAAVSEPQTKDKEGDVQMTGMGEQKAEPEKKDGDESSRGPVESEKKAAAEVAEEQPKTIVVDGDPNKDGGAAKRSAFQSPIMTAKPMPATTPGSGRRPSRRSSIARKSVDVETDGSHPQEAEDRDDKDSKDSKDDRSERESARNEPRRSMTGRLLRRGR
jgi:hypothetical protein